MINELSHAIRETRVITFRAKTDPTDRIAEPHILYETRNGNVLLDFYQTGGYSSSGSLPAWRCLLVDDIQALQILDDSFQIRLKEGYNPTNKRRYHRIICKL